MSNDACKEFVHETLLQIQHVEKLEIGRWLLAIMSSSKEDRDCIGGLPDSFIHRIISFVPSRKDRSWRNEWSDVVAYFLSNEIFCIDSKDIPLVEQLEIQYLVLEGWKYSKVLDEKPESSYLITKSLF
ncbi:hypothetical protein M5689_004439 [Euphorbia peplus]|nr:hypothetical protein M5689_004439 [Euphorbia peplus]